MIMFLFLLLPALGFVVAINTGAVESSLAWIITIVGNILNFILSPINELIREYIPDFSNALGAMNAWFGYVAQYVNWIADALLIPQIVINMALSYILFAFTVTSFAWGIKLVMNWYRALV